jgi:hypothetical protein
LEIVALACHGLHLGPFPNCTARAFDFRRHQTKYAPSAEAIKPKSSLPIMVLRLPNMARIERGEIRKLCDQDAGQDCAEFIIGRASRDPLARSGDLRVKADLSRRIKLIWAVQSSSQKYFCFSEMKIRLYE